MPDWSAVDGCVEGLLRRYPAPGLALAAHAGDAGEFAKGFGFRDVESRAAATADTVFPIASAGKSFTALAIMQLQDAKRLHVTDSVVRYLPEFKTPDGDSPSGITLHHLLTHTAGLPPLASRWFAFARDVARDYDPGDLPVRLDSRPPIDTYEQLLEYMAETPWQLLGPPGRVMSYSNEGYALLGAIIERVSGLSYPAYLRRSILAPLDLSHTAFDIDMPARGVELTSLYVRAGAPEGPAVKRVPRWWTSSVWLPAGGICSSVRDLVRYLRLFCGSPDAPRGAGIVSPAGVEAMLRPHASVSPRRAYGYGFEIAPDYAGAVLACHAGGRLGGSSHVLVVPDRSIVAAGLANFEDIPVWVATHAALHLLLGLPLDWRPAPYPARAAPVERLRAYVGEYAADNGRRMQVSMGSPGLQLHTDGQNYAARPVGVNAFAIQEAESEQWVQFLVDPRGRPWAVAHGLSILRRVKAPRRRGVRAAGRLWRRLRRAFHPPGRDRPPSR